MQFIEIDKMIINEALNHRIKIPELDLKTLQLQGVTSTNSEFHEKPENSLAKHLKSHICYDSSHYSLLI